MNIKTILKKKWVRRTLLIGFLAAAAGITYGIILWNTPHRDIESAKADMVADAVTIGAEFAKGDTSIDARYRDKVVAITGVVKKVIPGDSLCVLVIRGGDAYELTIEMLPKYKDEAAKTKPNEKVSVKALYMGFMEGDEDFGLPGDITFKKGSFYKEKDGK